MRNLALTLVILLSLGAPAACGSTVTSGTSGGTSGTSGGTSGDSSSSGGTGTCVPIGDPCVDEAPCCEGGGCYGGHCAACYVLEPQCMCGGVAMGPYGCTLGEACGTDGGTDAGLPDGGGACQCVQVQVQMTCD